MIWRMLASVVGSALLGALYALVLAWLGLSPQLDAEGWHFYARWCVMVSVVAIGVGVTYLYLNMRPIAQAIARVRAGEDPRSAAFATIKQRALNLPRELGIAVLLLWVAPLLSLPLIASVVAHTPDATTQLVAMVVTLGIGLVHATLVIHLVERSGRKEMIPILFPDGRVSDVEGARPVSFGVRLALLFITTGLFPILAFVTLVVVGTASVSAALFLGISSAALGALQAVWIAGGLARPAAALQRQLERVRAGHLDARVEVESGDQLARLSDAFNRMVEALARQDAGAGGDRETQPARVPA